MLDEWFFADLLADALESDSLLARLFADGGSCARHGCCTARPLRRFVPSATERSGSTPTARPARCGSRTGRWARPGTARRCRSMWSPSPRPWGPGYWCRTCSWCSAVVDPAADPGGRRRLPGGVPRGLHRGGQGGLGRGQGRRTGVAAGTGAGFTGRLRAQPDQPQPGRVRHRGRTAAALAGQRADRRAQRRPERVHLR